MEREDRAQRAVASSMLEKASKIVLWWERGNRRTREESWPSRLSLFLQPYVPRGVHTYWLSARA